MCGHNRGHGGRNNAAPEGWRGADHVPCLLAVRTNVAASHLFKTPQQMLVTAVAPESRRSCYAEQFQELAATMERQFTELGVAVDTKISGLDTTVDAKFSNLEAAMDAKLDIKFTDLQTQMSATQTDLQAILKAVKEGSVDKQVPAGPHGNLFNVAALL